jgi:amino acid adenylation domain-containing protein/non-ribosomal peptide synthase protein (TIGR01720 family)
MVVGFLGILQAGAVYVPLGPDDPPERQRFMLEDSQASVLLTQRHLAEHLPDVDVQRVWLEPDALPSAPPTADHPPIGPDDLAYMIYTSGTTGQPKGVCLHHRGLVNLADAQIDVFRLGTASRQLQFASLGFDAAIAEIVTTLLAGATLVIAPESRPNPAAFMDWLSAHEISHLTLPPSFLTQLPVQPWSSLETLVVAGERCPEDLVEAWAGCGTHRFLNAYGPTEITICATIAACEPGTGAPPPIGRPIRNTRIYVLDEYNQSQPIGIPGEIAVAGVGVASGYWNRPELTAQRFIEVPVFGRRERIYKTGDRGYWRADGQLDYIGRLDHQIKLRGFRIELEEIEAVLRSHALVREAAVVRWVREEHPFLVAYVTIGPGVTDSGIELRARVREDLKDRLPDYMIPAQVEILEALPRTPNGKIDRRALPEPQRVLGQAAFEAPRNLHEQRLASIWSTVLRRPDIGVYDDFFDLGGDSIQSIQLVSQARRAGLKLDPQDVFRHPTLADLARVVAPLEPGVESPDSGPSSVALNPFQKRLLDRDLRVSGKAVSMVLLQSDGDLDPEGLQQAMARIMEHHEALRLRYRRVGGHWEQRNDRTPGDCDTPFAIDPFRGTIEPDDDGSAAFADWLEERCAFWRQSLDPESGPLTRLILLRHPGGERLMWVAHRWVVDPLAWPILLEDLETAYDRVRRGAPSEFPATTPTFQWWNEQLQAWTETDAFASDIAYWRRQFPIAFPPVPADPSEGIVAPARPCVERLQWDAETTRRLRAAPSAYGAEVNDLVIAALVRVLSRWTGQVQQVLTWERQDRIHPFRASDSDMSRTVGSFSRVHPVIFQLPRDATSDEVIQSVKEGLRQIPSGGLGADFIASGDGSMPLASVHFIGLEWLCPLTEGSGRFHLVQFADDRAAVAVHDATQPLVISGSWVNGALNLVFQAVEGGWRRDTIRDFAAAVDAQLRHLIAHCASHFGYTPSDFPLARLDQSTLDRLLRPHGRNVEAVYPLSPMQQGMLFDTLYRPESGVYVEQLSLHLPRIDPERLRMAWQHLIDRHGALRTVFHTEQDPPLQVVLRHVTVPWENHDWRGLDPATQATQRQTMLAEERRRGFDLKHAPLLRFQLIRETDDTYRLLWNHHHLLLDGWSLPILIRELFAIDAALAHGDPPSLPDIPPYRDYVAWLEGQDLSAAYKYWAERLAGFTAPTPIPIAGSAVRAPRIQDTTRTVDPELYRALQATTRTQRVTLNTLVQAAWAILLGRYSGEDDVVFGVTLSGRQVPLAGVEAMIGLFINTLPLRVSLDTALPTLLQTVQTRQQEIHQYGQVSLGEVQHRSDLPAQSRLFDTLLVFQNIPVDEVFEPAEGPHLTADSIEIMERTDYLLTLVVFPGDPLTFKLSYDANRIPGEAAERLLRQLEVLLQGLVAQPTHQPHRLPLLTPEERRRLEAWNPDEVVPQTRTLPHLVRRFETCASIHPERDAVVGDTIRLSYGALNQRANQLAHRLINDYGVGPDVCVGVHLDRSPELLIGLLAVLKAGGAYVPLDPDYPERRLAFLIADSGVEVLLTCERLGDHLPESVTPLRIDDEPGSDGTLENPRVSITDDSLVYLIYTSGSTGQPKGTLINHGGFSQLLDWYIERLGLGAADRTLIISPIGFDLTQKNLFAPLLVGGQVHFTRSAPLDVPGMRDVIAHHGITWVNCAPSAFYPLVEAAPQPRAWTKCASLRWVVLGGEPIALERLRDWLEYPETRARIMNSYGPTESTDVVAAYVPDDPLASGDGGALPIGYPLPGYRIYLLDAFQQPVPPGLPGEVCIAGPGLARGYHRRPDLTEQAFVTAEVLGRWERLYRTGDRARQRPDGALVYLGRVDNQVKIRGQRIELAEVERAIRHQPEVREAVATVVETDSDQRLVAYLVPAFGAGSGDLGGPAFDEADLMNRLRGCLPAAMVPTAFIRLSELPLTPNGKIDRGALPPPAADPGRVTPSVEPRDETERALVGIWEDLLGVRGLGIHDSFFDLGGHSLLAIRLLGRIEQRWHQCLPVATLFDAPTIAGLADRLRQDVPPSLRLTLRPGQYGPRIYCLPGALGDTFYFRDLLAHLPAGQPVLGLQSPGVDADQPRPTGLERHAAMLVALIDGLEGDEPMGPPLLVGHSMGGIVAFEVARQREQRGHRVGLVVIVDTPAQVDPRWAERVEEMTEGEWMGAIATELTLRPVETLGLEARVLDGLDEHERWARLTSRLQEAGVFPADTDPTHLRQWVERYRANTQNALAYRPSDAIEAPIVLVRAQDSIAALAAQSAEPEALAQRWDWGWQAYAQQTVAVIDAPGDHTSVMEQPQVARWAEQLTPFVTTAKNDAGSP